ncbi:MAG: hypothetical protein H0W72_03370 [Planctomycetes bacterium]|nr:hypothetical protein [Planctomycetota bacterium]
MTRYRIAMHRGKPSFLVDGRPAALPSYCACAPQWKQQWLAAHRHFAKHGRDIFWIMPNGGWNGEWGTTPFWTGPGRIHDTPLEMPAEYMGLDQQARALLEIAPDARFFVRMSDHPPASWGKGHPDHMLLNHQGKRYESASLASDLYLGELDRYLQAVTRFCEGAPWADRIIGYVIYPMGEGATPLACDGFLFDQSPVMLEKFRAYLRTRYGTDQALQSAWRDPQVRLDTALVPGDDDFRRRGQPILHWPEADAVQRERDYFACQPPLFRRYLETMLAAFRSAAGPEKLCGVDAFKGNMAGWMTHPIFFGKGWKTHYGDQFLATGTTGLAQLLDHDALAIVATPHDYRCRWPGFGYDPEGIGDSIQLRGKMMLVEEDQRTHANDERGTFGSVEPGEEEAVFYRNLAASISKGHQTYPMDVCVGYFEDAGIQGVLRRRTELEAAHVDIPRADVPSVVMLVDDRSSLYTDFSAEYNDLAVIRQRIHGMNHCGVPTRTFLWDDLRRDDFPACHRLFLLPNSYLADESTAAALRDRLFRNGNVIVFYPGSGITDGRTVAPDGAARLLGIDFEMYDYEYPRFVTVDGWGHPLTAGFGACDSFGDTHRYGPVLVPFDRSAAVTSAGQPSRKALCADGRPFTRLGTIALDSGKRRPGLVVKEFGRGAAGNSSPGIRGAGDYAVVFTAAAPLPARLLRNLARFSGTHVYDDEDDVVYADATMVAVHAVKPGPRRIALPDRCQVTDRISGTALGEMSVIAFTVERTVTRWFSLAPLR